MSDSDVWSAAHPTNHKQFLARWDESYLADWVLKYGASSEALLFSFKLTPFYEIWVLFLMSSWA